MNVSWKEIKAEIDGLPKTEKTLLLKKKAEGFQKELKDKIANAFKNAETWQQRFRKSKTKQQDAWYETASEEWQIIAHELSEILGDDKE